MNHRDNRSRSPLKDILLATTVILYAWGMYALFTVIWLCLLLILYWLMVNPVVIVGIGMLYFVLFAPSFYPILTDEPPFHADGHNDGPRLLL